MFKFIEPRSPAYFPILRVFVTLDLDTTINYSTSEHIHEYRLKYFAFQQRSDTRMKDISKYIKIMVQRYTL